MFIKINFMYILAISLLCFPLYKFYCSIIYCSMHTFIIDLKDWYKLFCRMIIIILLVLKVSTMLISSSPALPSWCCHLSLHCHPLPALKFCQLRGQSLSMLTQRSFTGKNHLQCFQYFLYSANFGLQQN